MRPLRSGLSDCQKSIRQADRAWKRRIICKGKHRQCADSIPKCNGLRFCRPVLHEIECSLLVLNLSFERFHMALTRDRAVHEFLLGTVRNLPAGEGTERRAIVFGRASSCTEPVLVRPSEASKSPGSSSSWTRSPGCWRWSGWSRIWKARPELLHDTADSGLTSPMATFSAHTASPPPPSRTPPPTPAGASRLHR